MRLDDLIQPEDPADSYRQRAVCDLIEELL